MISMSEGESGIRYAVVKGINGDIAVKKGDTTWDIIKGINGRDIDYVESGWVALITGYDSNSQHGFIRQFRANRSVVAMRNRLVVVEYRDIKGYADKSSSSGFLIIHPNGDIDAIDKADLISRYIAGKQTL